MNKEILGKMLFKIGIALASGAILSLVAAICFLAWTVNSAAGVIFTMLFIGLSCLVISMIVD